MMHCPCDIIAQFGVMYDSVTAFGLFELTKILDFQTFFGMKLLWDDINDL